MKEWCVVQCKPRRMTDVRYGDRRNDGSNGVYTATWSKESQDLFESPMADSQQLFFVNTEIEANRLMTELAQANPGVEYGKARVLTVAHSASTPAVLARFTERGLMPV